LISAFQELIERELRIAQGTIIGAQKIFETKSFNIAGGTHHAFLLMAKLLFAK
jgi:acetoin utilization deacetylase AcuC-like enzyme